MILNRKLRVVGISGSLRRESYNRKALNLAKHFASELDVSIDELDPKELIVPLYNTDIELQGFPPSVQSLREKVGESDVLLIATPEYNHSISGSLKNAIDWLSTGKNVLDGKFAAIFGASTGLHGTLRAQIHLRQILTALNLLMIPQPQVFIHTADVAFNDDGSLKDLKLNNQLRELIQITIKLAKVSKENK